VWLNLEGLTAEEWVEGCHALTSPRHGMIKHFFFPGFTDKTGGLLREASLDARRQAFQADAAGMAAFLGQLGMTPAEVAALKYPCSATRRARGRAVCGLAGGERAVVCLVPEGVAFDAVQAFSATMWRSRARRTRAARTVRVLPFVPQDDYDRLLWACDVNSCAARIPSCAPSGRQAFLWHIYIQDENLHHVKLRAFLQRYAVDAQGSIDSLVQAALAWNGATADPLAMGAAVARLQADMPRIVARAQEWQGRMQANGDLASNLLAFASATR
jgi:uncharacterized repeat protein (TIGR03837 family)